MYTLNKSTFLDLEDNYDYLYIDGTQYNDETEFEQTVGKDFTIRLTTDYSVTKQGFRIEWQCAGAFAKTFDGELTLTYDVDRPTNIGGDILVRDGYFIHFISPESLPPLPKNIIFVIDKSGSMYGQRMDQTKQAFETIVNDLHDDDYFQAKMKNISK